MKVTILATPKLVDLAKTAIEIQDACNPVPICSFLQKCISYWCGGNFESKDEGQSRFGSDIAMQNPVTGLVMNKLESLANMEQGNPNDQNASYFACVDLSEGKNVEYNVEFN